MLEMDDLKRLRQIYLTKIVTNGIINKSFDEQERHPALLREPDMMDTPPIQMITERWNENNVLFLGYFGIVSTEVMPYFFTEMKKIIIKYREYLKWIKI